MHLTKSIGYGLNDLEADDIGNITDPRLLLETKTFYYTLRTKSLQDYIEFLKAKVEKIKATGVDDSIPYEYLNTGTTSLDIEIGMLGEKDLNQRIGDFVVYQNEADPNTILFQPPVYLWTREGDTIEIAESEFYKEDIPITKESGAGFSPWEHLKIDSRDSRRIPFGDSRDYMNNKLYPDSESLRIKNSLAKICGFNSYPEADKFMIPFIPEEIYWFNEFIGAFDMETLVQFRPYIFTYYA